MSKSNFDKSECADKQQRIRKRCVYNASVQSRCVSVLQPQSQAHSRTDVQQQQH